MVKFYVFPLPDENHDNHSIEVYYDVFLLSSQKPTIKIRDLIIFFAERELTILTNVISQNATRR